MNCTDEHKEDTAKEEFVSPEVASEMSKILGEDETREVSFTEAQHNSIELLASSVAPLQSGYEGPCC